MKALIGEVSQARKPTLVLGYDPGFLKVWGVGRVKAMGYALRNPSYEST